MFDRVIMTCCQTPIMICKWLFTTDHDMDPAGSLLQTDCGMETLIMWEIIGENCIYD